MGFPCGSAGKESACNAGDLGSIPGLRRSPGGGKGCPVQYSGLEKSRDCRVHGVAKHQAQLSLSLSDNDEFSNSPSGCLLFYLFCLNLYITVSFQSICSIQPNSVLCLVAQLCPTFVTLWTVAHRLLCPWGLSRQEYWSGSPCLPPRDLSNPGIEPWSPVLQADSLPADLPGKPSSTWLGPHKCCLFLYQVVCYYYGCFLAQC